MIGKRLKRKGVVGALAIMAALTLSLTAVFGFPSGITAHAERGNGEKWKIDEIYDDKAQSFNGDKIMDLIEALTGKRSFGDLEKAAKAAINSDPPETFFRTSADFRDLNGGNNVSVIFGGIKWDAVYLTTANGGAGTQKGDIILDLWRSADTLTLDDAATYSGFWSDKSTEKEYPSNMYSTSKIRVETLNAGGKYTKSDGSESNLTEHNQDSGNKYARFTMESAPNSLTEYLAKPSEVGYQETESDEGTMKSFYGYAADYYFLPNDAYGTPAPIGATEEPPGQGKAGEHWYNDGSIDMSAYSGKGGGATAYGAWKDDYLWLPSLTETGMSDDAVKDIIGSGPDFVGDGMWDTDAALRSANSGVGLGRCWLRSGGAYNAQRAYLLNASGNRDLLVVNNANNDKDSCGVRPAIHFNLTAAAHKAILDKESWPGDSRPYDPQGVKWEIMDTDLVDVAAAPDGGDTSWWDDDTNTITATRVGEYKLTITPKPGFIWKDDNSAGAITVTYTVTPVNMAVTFGGEKLEKRRDVYFGSGAAIALRLPDPTDRQFPIRWDGVAWYGETKDKIAIQYIVKKYTEQEHNQEHHYTAIERYLSDLKAERQTDEVWKNYDDLDEEYKIAREPEVYYTVYFKAVDNEGNHKPCYDYFEVHVAAEHLEITLTDAAIAGLNRGVEYGDVARTKEDFRRDIIGGIKSVTATATEPGKPDTDRTKAFKDNIDNFEFYFRKDNSGTDGEIYTVEEDGIHLSNGSQKADNLPLGTYRLYVAVADENVSEYITVKWADGIPEFEVTPRKVKVTLTFADMIYGQDPAGWVTATASRATEGARGSWYAPNEAAGEDNLDILNLSCILQETGAAPSATTPAGAYTVVATWSNPNYNVEFTDADGGDTLTFTIAKAIYADVTRLEYTFPGSDLPNVIVESADGFDPALKLICDGADEVKRTFLAWGKDEISDAYAVKLMRGDEEIALVGKATVRLLIPEELRGRAFALKSADGAAVEYTRDGDYAVFETSGLSTYAFTVAGNAYLPILIAAAAVSLLCLGALIISVIVIKKNKKGE